MTTSLTYKPMSHDAIEALPPWTILARTWQSDPEPELYRHSPARNEPSWVLLDRPDGSGDLERCDAQNLHSEYALYAVIYQPEETA